MRRITFFKTLLVAIALVVGSANVKAQESIIYSTGFESADGFTAGTVYNNSTIAYTGASGNQWGTYFGTPSTTSPIVGSQSIQLRWYTTTASSLGYTFTNFDKPNVTKVTFNAANTAGINLIVSYSTDGGSTYTGAQTFTLTTTSTTYTYTLSTDPAGFVSPVRFKFQLTYTSAPAGTSRLYLDNIAIYGIPPAVPVAATPVISLLTGNYYTPQNVTISCSTPSSSIYYSVDGSVPSNTSPTSILFTDAIAVNLTQTLKAIAYATGFTASSINSAAYTFPTTIANIATLRTSPTSGFYKLTGEAVLTYQSPATFGKPKFIQDATGGILIYDSGAKISTNYNLNDGITGLIGTLSLYNGYLLEFYPVTDPGVATSTNNTVIPAIASIATLANYPSQLVTVKNVAITGTGNFAASTNYTVNDGAAGFLRTAYTDLPYIATAIPTGAQDITGIVLNNSITEVDLVPRTAADMVSSTVTSTKPVSMISTIYTSNNSIFFSAHTGESVQIFNATGQRLIQKLAVEGLNSIAVSAKGVVLVKVGDRFAKVIL
ncbi:MAG: chitobiase/beta-hexosaminidase C-terminal domain-containing protein [Paludibacter sp.]|nr:chitobiase/beta-hexosaminidase C-terminal domain-containing protein [Paludibacter sp.]